MEIEIEQNFLQVSDRIHILTEKKELCPITIFLSLNE